MLMIRLQRFGKKNQPSYRVVVTDKRNSARSGNACETVGWYNPRTHEHVFEKERVLHWLGLGAQASGTVHNMLVRGGLVKGKKIDVAPHVKVEPKAEPPAAEKTAPVETSTAPKREEIPVAAEVGTQGLTK